MTKKRTKVTANEDDWWKRKDTDWQRTTFGVNTSGIANMKNGIFIDSLNIGYIAEKKFFDVKTFTFKTYPTNTENYNIMSLI